MTEATETVVRSTKRLIDKSPLDGHKSYHFEIDYISLPKKLHKARIYRRKLALLLPGHNEELIIQATINSAIAAGQTREDIYMVDDASTDKTRVRAVELLGKDHVMTVKRSGKAGAVKKAIKKFDVEKRYNW